MSFCPKDRDLLFPLCSFKATPLPVLTQTGSALPNSQDSLLQTKQNDIRMLESREQVKDMSNISKKMSQSSALWLKQKLLLDFDSSQSLPICFMCAIFVGLNSFYKIFSSGVAVITSPGFLFLVERRHGRIPTTPGVRPSGPTGA